MPDDQALKLIGFEGKPRKRFKFTPEQARMLLVLQAIDSALGEFVFSRKMESARNVNEGLHCRSRRRSCCKRHDIGQHKLVGHLPRRKPDRQIKSILLQVPHSL